MDLTGFYIQWERDLSLKIIPQPHIQPLLELYELIQWFNFHIRVVFIFYGGVSAPPFYSYLIDKN